MVVPGNNPPPSDPFAPSPPPQPGQFGPGPMGPGPYGPGPIGPSSFQPAPPSGGSNAWKYILIGCAAVLLLGGIITVGSCVFLASKGGSFVNGAMKLAKPEYMKNLSPDHTPEQRARFEEAYDFYAKQSEDLGVVEWGTKYSDATEKLSAMQADGQITVEESQAWADMILNPGSEPAAPGTAEGSTTAGNSGGDSGSDSGGDSGGDFGRSKP